MFKIKVEISFYYKYLQMLLFVDTLRSNVNILRSDTVDDFLFLNDKYANDLFKFIYVDRVQDEEVSKKIEKLIKFINNERNSGKNVSTIRDLLYTNFSSDIDKIIKHDFAKQYNINNVSDFSTLLKYCIDFNKSLKMFVKNMLSVKYINALTGVLLENISNSNINNISKISNTFEKIIHEYIGEESLFSFDQIILRQDNVYEELSKFIKTKIAVMENEKIPTGFQFLDSFLNGGMQKKRVYLVVGKTGQGKSAFVINLVKNFLESGKNILFYTFENTLEETMERLLSCITKIPLTQIKQDELVIKTKEFFDKYNGKINIIYAPADSICVESIKEKTKTDKYDIIVIDYLDLLKYKRNVEERIRTMKLVRSLKNLAQETNTVVISPTQVHRSAYRNKIVEVDNVAESFGKIAESDVVFILETTTKELINENRIRLNIGKSRHGKSGIRIEMTVNFETMTFTETGNIITDVNEIEDDDDDADFDNEKEKMKQKKRKKNESDIENGWI